MSPGVALRARGSADLGCVVNPNGPTAGENGTGTLFSGAVEEFVVGTYDLVKGGESADAFSEHLDVILGRIGLDVIDWAATVVSATIGEKEIPYGVLKKAQQDPCLGSLSLGFYLAGIVSLDLADEQEDGPDASRFVVLDTSGRFVQLDMMRFTEMLCDGIVVNACRVDLSGTA